MKKCPYCAELIQNDARHCRFCGQKLSSPLAQFSQERKDPPFAFSLILGILLLVVINAPTRLILLNWSETDLYLPLIFYLFQIVSMCVVAKLAEQGLDPRERKIFLFIDLIIFSIIPILGWIVYYWAGKGLARTLSGMLRRQKYTH